MEQIGFKLGVTGQGVIDGGSEGGECDKVICAG